MNTIRTEAPYLAETDRTAAERQTLQALRDQALRAFEELTPGVWTDRASGMRAFSYAGGDESMLASDRDDRRTVDAMVAVATATGWQAFEARGTDRFEARAYRTAERVRARLNDAEQEVRPNTLENAPHERAPRGIEEEHKRSDAASRTPPAEKPASHTNAALLAQLHQQWRVAGARYYTRAGPAHRVAFVDHGNRLSTAENTERVAQAIVQLAAIKGWRRIRVSGHGDFKQLVWREARARDMAVEGYAPSEQEKAALAPKGSKSATTENQTARPKAAESVITGRLIEHGSAPYRHEAKRSASYYVTLDVDGRRRTRWGVGLKHAIAASTSQPGDTITLRRAGKEAVTVTATNGRVRTVQRTRWAVETTRDERRILEAVASAVIEEHVRDAASRERLRAALAERFTRAEREGALPTVHTQARPPREASRQRSPERIR